MSVKFLNILVDETPVKVGSGHTILQTCASAGIEIPRFCYHDKLLIAGNCRICLVEISGSKKLVASCAVHATNNMIIYSNTVRVRLARQNVLEFLLANHPLDCPICDQGGECDLQDITAVFGADRGRFYENTKRAVLNKDFGPLIRTSMNRCIHCTRCVRFMALSSGFPVLGTVGRGSSTEISTYVSQFIDDELSGNITDLCPVGALTSKPFSFKARPWELTSVEGFDVLDTLNSQLSLDVAANRILRVLPYANDSLNECWLSNRARYAYDGLFVQRLSNCLLKISFQAFAVVRNYKLCGEFYVKLPWSSAILILLKKLTSRKITAIAAGLGDSFDLESTFGAKVFFESIGAGLVTVDRITLAHGDFNFLYLFNTSLVKLSKIPTFCLLVGTNLRLESPLLNLRLSKLVATHNSPVYRLGSASTYIAFKTKYLSSNFAALFQIAEFTHPFCKNFYLPTFSSLPLILVGQAAVSKLGESITVSATVEFISRIRKIASNANFFTLSHLEFNSFSVLNTYSSRIHALDAGLNTSFSKTFYGNTLNAARGSKYRTGTLIFYSLGFDHISFKDMVNARVAAAENLWVVYQGTHGNGVAASAHLILPIFSYVESAMFYRNLLGDVKKSKVAVAYNYSLKTNLDIFRLLLEGVVTASPLFRFSTLNFMLSTTFNWNLLVSHDLMVSSSFLLPFKKSAALINPHLYLNLYQTLFAPETTEGALRTVEEFYTKLLVLPSLVCIPSAPLASTVLNYYGDSNLVLLGSSRTMNLCSNLTMKKNWSFTTLFY